MWVVATLNQWHVSFSRLLYTHSWGVKNTYSNWRISIVFFHSAFHSFSICSFNLFQMHRAANRAPNRRRSVQLICIQSTCGAKSKPIRLSKYDLVGRTIIRGTFHRWVRITFPLFPSLSDVCLSRWPENFHSRFKLKMFFLFLFFSFRWLFARRSSTLIMRT